MTDVTRFFEKNLAHLEKLKNELSSYSIELKYDVDLK